jgi:hypothetical protein
MSEISPIDPDVRIPKAVREIKASVEALHKSVYNAPADATQGEGQESETGSEPTFQVAIEPIAPVTPQGNPPSPSYQKRVEDGFAPQTPATAQPEVSRETSPAVDWEHKYKSLEGRFRAQNDSIKALSEQITGLQNALIRQEAAKPPPVDQPPAAPVRLVTPEEEQTFGPDLLGVVGKRAQEVLAPELEKVQRLTAHVQTQLEQVSNASKAASEHRFYQDMDAALSDWRETNNDPEFLAWLDLPDTYSGRIRNQLLTEAYTQHSAKRVLAFFKGFRAEQAATAPANRRGAKVPLADLAAPGRQRTSAGPTPPAEKPTITGSQISAHSQRAARVAGYAGSDQYRAMEAAIQSAILEGRIDQTR